MCVCKCVCVYIYIYIYIYIYVCVCVCMFIYLLSQFSEFPSLIEITWFTTLRIHPTINVRYIYLLQYNHLISLASSDTRPEICVID